MHRLLRTLGLLFAALLWLVNLLNDIDAQGNHSGIAADDLDQVRSRMGVNTEIVAFASVADMLDALRAGSIDVVPFLTRTTGRAREFVFSQPDFSMPYMLVARSDAPMYRDLPSLRVNRDDDGRGGADAFLARPADLHALADTLRALTGGDTA